VCQVHKILTEVQKTKHLIIFGVFNGKISSSAVRSQKFKIKYDKGLQNSLPVNKPEQEYISNTQQLL
jgi:hypothetical protein